MNFKGASSVNNTIMMATGETEINSILSEELKDHAQSVDNAMFKEDLLMKLEKFKPHYLILGDGLTLLEEQPERDVLIKEVRRKFPGTRIIYIYHHDQDELPVFLKFLVNQQVFDFLSSSDLDLNDLIHLLKQPREYSQVKHYEEYSTAEPEALKESISEGSAQSTEIIKQKNKFEFVKKEFIVPVPKFMQSTGESKIVIKKESLYITQKQRTIIWYAPTSNGTSTIAQNTAVYLAERDSNTDIALVDFDFAQPKLATRMKLNQKNRQGKMHFEELLQRIDGNRFDAELLLDYMYTHPKYPNLKIFSCEFSKMEYQHLLDTHHVERILEVLKEEFGILMVDINRDIELVGNDVCFKKATAIYHVLDYDYSHCKEFQKMRMIMAQIPFIQNKPKRLIVNKGFNHPKFQPKLIQDFYKYDEDDDYYVSDHLDPVPITQVPLMYEQQMNAIMDGDSIVSSTAKYNETFRLAIHEIAQTILPIDNIQIKNGFLQNIKKKLSRLKTEPQTTNEMIDHA